MAALGSSRWRGMNMGECAESSFMGEDDVIRIEIARYDDRMTIITASLSHFLRHHVIIRFLRYETREMGEPRFWGCTLFPFVEVQKQLRI